MKQFKALFILLIGMISFTAMATTPLTKQKQKMEISKDFENLVIADVVLTKSVAVHTDISFTKFGNSEIQKIFLILDKPRPVTLKVVNENVRRNYPKIYHNKKPIYNHNHSLEISYNYKFLNRRACNRKA